MKKTINKVKKTKKVAKALKEIKREVIDKDHVKITYSDKSEQILFV